MRCGPGSCEPGGCAGGKRPAALTPEWAKIAEAAHSPARRRVSLRLGSGRSGLRGRGRLLAGVLTAGRGCLLWLGGLGSIGRLVGNREKRERDKTRDTQGNDVAHDKIHSVLDGFRPERFARGRSRGTSKARRYPWLEKQTPYRWPPAVASFRRLNPHGPADRGGQSDRP